MQQDKHNIYLFFDIDYYYIISEVFKMNQEDFFELFYSNLRQELIDDDFVDDIEQLISSNKFNKSNYLKIIRGE